MKIVDDKESINGTPIEVQAEIVGLFDSDLLSFFDVNGYTGDLNIDGGELALLEELPTDWIFDSHPNFALTVEFTKYYAFTEEQMLMFDGALSSNWTIGEALDTVLAGAWMVSEPIEIVGAI